MRYAFAGYRPGQSFWIDGLGLVQTHELDGGAFLDEVKRAKIERAGYTLVPLSDHVPAAPSHKIDPIAAANMNANGDLARKVAVEQGALAPREPRKRP